MVLKPALSNSFKNGAFFLFMKETRTGLLRHRPDYRVVFHIAVLTIILFSIVTIRTIDLPADFKEANKATVKAAETTKENLTVSVHDDGNTRNTNENIAKKVHNLICDEKKGNNAWKGLCSQNFVTVSSQRILENSQGGDEDINIVQIGAHTGWEENDLIATGLSRLLDETIALDPNTYKAAREHFHWIFVEPSPTNFKRLSVNLKKHSDVCDMRGINAAVVSDTLTNDGKDLNMTFYSIRDTIDPETGYDSLSGKTLPKYITQVSSFSKKPIMHNQGQFRKIGLNVHDYIVETHVDTKTYSNLMKEALVRRNSEKIVPPLLVLIDTEGFDCEIIKGIPPLSPYLPNYLVYENKQCNSTESNEYLKSMGYNIYPVGEDTLAVKKVKAIVTTQNYQSMKI